MCAIELIAYGLQMFFLICRRWEPVSTTIKSMIIPNSMRSIRSKRVEMKQDEVQSWLINFFSKRNDLSRYDRDKLLNCNYFEEGLIDSLGIIKLIISMEQELTVKFGNDVFQDRRFVTILGLSEIVSEQKTISTTSMEKYTKQDISAALVECGVKAGDVLFSHSNIGYWGTLDGSETDEETCASIYDAIFDVIGDSGTLIVPTFTYSFGGSKKCKIFDVENTKSMMGVFAEYVRQLPNSWRSYDPMFSVSAVGARAMELTNEVPVECFGDDSFWARFLKMEGKICNFNFDSGSTLIHFVEKQLSVPYRKDYDFSGTIVTSDDIETEKTVVFFCRDLADSGAVAKFERFDVLAREHYSKTAVVGRGEVVVISAQETFDLIENTLPSEPNFLVTA